MSSWSML